jgi:membrane dipeptidase
MMTESMGSSAAAKARELHRKAIVVDTHNDNVIRLIDLGHDLSKSGNPGFMDLPKMIEGNLTVTFWASMVLPEQYHQGTHRERLEQMMSAIEEFCSRHSDKISMARTAPEIRKLAKAGKLAAVHCIEGGQVIGSDLAYLEELARRGVRYIGLTHFNSNDWADSSTDVVRHHGLSELGRRAVAEMERLGIIVDVSHSSDDVFWQAIEMCQAPFMASHSAARSVVNLPRNLSDEMLTALGKKGGLACLNCFPPSLSMDVTEAVKRRTAELKKAQARSNDISPSLNASGEMMRQFANNPQRQYEMFAECDVPMPNVARVVDHIDRLVEFAGIDHVGFGMDHGAVNFEIGGLENATKLPALTEELLKRGYSDDDVLKVLGENVLSFLDRHDSVRPPVMG